MNDHALFTLFSRALNWNALFYAIHRLASFIYTLFMYTHLPINDFAHLINSQSIIFLAILITDFGFRKSIPRFIPEFAHSTHFIKQIFRYQIAIIALTMPCIIFYLYDSNNLVCTSLIALFFITQTMISLIRLIYHAHFLNKQFNSILLGGLALEIMSVFCLIPYISNGYHLIAIIAAKLISDIGVIAVTAPYIHKSIMHETIETHDFRANMLFIKHSFNMWVATLIKCISERNVMIPIITALRGPIDASLYKIANDGALIFFRFIIKTIGTADTTLLTQIEISDTSKKAMPFAFKKLTHKVAALCIPLVVLIICIFIYGIFNTKHHYVFQLFIIMALGYLIETCLLPYERILEIKKQYLILYLSYIPYTIGMVLIFYLLSNTSIGMLPCIVIIQGVRLVSSLIMVYCALRHYTLH